MDGQASHCFEFGPFCLDADNRLLKREGQPVVLTPKALETLLALVERSGEVVGKRELLDRVWPDAFVEEGTLVQNIFTLRKALGRDASGRDYIETAPRRGYCFTGPVTERGRGPALLVLEKHSRSEITIQEEDSAEPIAVVSRRRKAILAFGLAGVLLAAFAVVILPMMRGSSRAGIRWIIPCWRSSRCLSRSRRTGSRNWPAKTSP